MAASGWPALETPRLPGREQVLLISAPLDLPRARLDQLAASFTPHEQARAARYATQELRDRWSAARGLLRALLAALTGGEASRIRFRYREHGKPELDPQSVPPLPPDLPGGAGGPGGAPLDFNVSHSKGRAMFAFARGREVGVDLEEMRARRSDDLARRYFAPAESAALLAIADAGAREQAFFFLWSAKEAFIKATGAGLSQSLSSFEFRLEEIAPPPGLAPPARLLAPVGVVRHRGDPQAASRWSVHPVAPAPGFSGSLVAEGRPREILLRSWDAL